MKGLQLSIIIVNYKTPGYTAAAIKSIYEQTRSISFEILVADNDSRDDSRELITSGFPAVKWVQLPSNFGYGRAINEAVKSAEGQHLLFLNSDLVILDRAIDKTFEYFTENKKNKIGIVACRLLNSDMSEQRSVYYTNAGFNELIYENCIYIHFFQRAFPIQSKEIRVLKGAFLMMEYAVFKEAGCFDPDFFMFSEESHLCRKIMRLDYKLGFYPGASVIHFEEKSFFNNETRKVRYISSFIMLRKIHGIAGLLLWIFLYFINFLMFIPFSLFYKRKVSSEEYKRFYVFFSVFAKNFKKIIHTKNKCSYIKATRKLA